MSFFIINKNYYRPTRIYLSKDALEHNALCIKNYISQQENTPRIPLSLWKPWEIKKKSLELSCKEIKNFKEKKSCTLDLEKKPLFHNNHVHENCQDSQYTTLPEKRIFFLAMVKANAYGHGLRSCGQILEPLVDGFGVASMDEALALRQRHITKPIVLMEGFFSPKEYKLAAAYNISAVVHQEEQLKWLMDILCKESFKFFHHHCDEDYDEPNTVQENSLSLGHQKRQKWGSVSFGDFFQKNTQNSMDLYQNFPTNNDLHGKYKPQEEENLLFSREIGKENFFDDSDHGSSWEMSEDNAPKESHHGFSNESPMPPFWLKINTGMNRLGLPWTMPLLCTKTKGGNQELTYLSLMALRSLTKNSTIFPLGIMMHFACGDDLSEKNTEQLMGLRAFLHSLEPLFDYLKENFPQCRIPMSFANGAALFHFPELHNLDLPVIFFARPGLPLYGISPYGEDSPVMEQLSLGAQNVLKNLYPVMHLVSRIISIQYCKKGSSIGYGAQTLCKEDKCIAVVAVGYGDGYPFSMEEGAPVLIKTKSGDVLCSLFGRMSMDMMTVDITNTPAELGDDVILWGRNPSVSTLTSFCKMHSWAIVTSIQNRVHTQWISTKTKDRFY